MTAADLILYGSGYSTYTRTARLALEEKGVAYRLVEIDFLRGANKTPEHLSRHPFGKVPVLEHGDLKLYETSAITEYIDSPFSGAPLQPKDARARARMLQVIGIANSYLYPPQWSVRFWSKASSSPCLGKPPIKVSWSRASAGSGRAWRFSNTLSKAPHS